MLISLIKKDFLLIKKYLLIMLAVTIATPLFIMLRIPELLSFGAFLISTIFAEFMLYQYVLLAELKYPKVEALLCATPYPRRTIVIARYMFLLLIFSLCFLLYSALAVIFPQIQYLSPSSLLITLLISTILFGIYTPVQYKLGFEKTKYFFSIVILATPFLLPVIIKQIDLNSLSSISETTGVFIMIFAIIIILYISIAASIRIYQIKEML